MYVAVVYLRLLIELLIMDAWDVPNSLAGSWEANSHVGLSYTVLIKGR